ncbi:MAG: Hsp70 family protein [Myxococcales bacterium]|nr:Hsp70 family protein [Myxococcales bacterium]
MSTPARAVGIDFGTTNSTVAVCEPDGRVRLARFPLPQIVAGIDDAAAAETFRSVLYFRAPEPRRPPQAEAGPGAIDAFLDEGEGRLMKSLKTFLSSSSFQVTQVHNRQYSLTDLVGYFLRALRAEAEKTLGPLGRRAVAGRPVRFAGAEDAEAEALAVERLSGAMAAAGFDDLDFEFEPVAAAFTYEASLTRDENVLIGDFGGGTSDFCLLRVGPSAASRRRRDAVLSTGGVGIAGDVFDARIVRHVVAPALGDGSHYRALGQQTMPIPSWPYENVEAWHRLPFLKDRKTMQLLVQLAADALEPEKLRALVHLVRHDLGFQLHRAVQATKVALSSAAEAPLVFRDGPIDLRTTVRRADFEAWIADDVARIAGAVDETLAAAGLPAEAVDRVFLTGGTSFVPCVRRLFDQRFGPERVVAGAAFTSVGAGLARRAAE